LPDIPPHVIVCEAAERNVIGAAKDHEADEEPSVHDPDTVHAPPDDEVMYAVVAATLTLPATETVDPPAVRAPFAATVRVETVSARFDVARVVAALPPWTVIAPAFRPRVRIVNVTAFEPLLNTTAENSLPERFEPAKVIVCDVAELKVTVAVPADHEALVEAFVHEPLNVHGPLPKAMYAEDAETFTLPATLPLDAPDIVMFALPDRVRAPPTVKPVAAVAAIVIEPPECVTFPETAKSKVPMAIVPIVEPVVTRDAIAAFTFTVAVPEPLLLSK